jgi:predicted DNA-binding transcriptional regulator YafY
MNPQQKLLRMLRLLLYLQEKPRYIADCAANFEIHKRSIYRYLITFQEAGFDVQKVEDATNAPMYFIGKKSAGQELPSPTQEEKDILVRIQEMEAVLKKIAEELK